MLALVVLLSLVVARPLSVRADGPNLVQNPGFERPYVALPKKENCAVAAPWVAWFREGTLAEVSQGYRFAPEYKAAFRADYPGNRVRNGELAQQWFHSYGNFEAGVLQQVSNIAVGSKLRFEIWGMSWSCDKESSGRCGGAVSYNGSPMHFKIGIDPTGGGEPFSPAIIWSEENNAYDNWTLFQVEAVAQKSTVTVYVYSYPTYRSQDNNIYLDDASLVVVAAPPAPTRKPTVAPTFTPLPAPTSVPPTAVPPPTSVPPTAVPPPTSVPPTAAPLPTNPPVPTSALKPSPTHPPVVIPTPATVSLAQQLTSGQGLFVLLGGLLAIVIAFVVGLALGRRK
jgi:hypothetical protein